MRPNRFDAYRPLAWGGWAALALAAACSSNSSTHDAGPSTGVVAAVTCMSPATVPTGPATTRCQLADGGPDVQPVSAASCNVGGDAGDDTCAYGDTLFGQEGPDDDCKYHVAWTSTSLCQSVTLADGSPGPGVVFTVVATYSGHDDPADRREYAHRVLPDRVRRGGIGRRVLRRRHGAPGPTMAPAGGLYEMTETTPGTYVGQIAFDAPGAWTLRFHFNENCLDVLPDSPHGHAAFHLTIP